MESYQDCIVFLLAKAYQKAHGNLKKRLHSYGLTPIQFLTLATLVEEFGIFMSRLFLESMVNCPPLAQSLLWILSTKATAKRE